MGRQLQSNPVTCSLCPVHSRHSPHRLARDQPGLQDRTADRQHRLEAAPEISQDPDEAIENVTMSVEEALEACRDGSIRDGKTLATFLLAQLHGYI